ncbi:MAG: lysophospholipid acyltransferase family protein [Candidatus Omnitrophota bacterium]
MYNYKKIKQWFKRRMGLWALKFFCCVLPWFPRSCVYGLGNIVAAIAYVIAGRQRKIARSSLDIAFGREKTVEEKEGIIRECFAKMAKGALEVVASLNNPRALSDVATIMVTIEGKEYLDKALSKGKGVVIASGHFGNFPLLLTKLSYLGYKVNIVVRRMHDKKTDTFFDYKRSALGIKSIYTHPRSTCVRESIRALRNGELVFVLMDQHFGAAGGVLVDFFGRKAATAGGGVVFALRTAAPIVPAFIVGEGDGRHRLIIEPELTLRKAEDKEEMLRLNVAAITAIIERYVRQYPAEWSWIHRRWK